MIARTLLLTVLLLSAGARGAEVTHLNNSGDLPPGLPFSEAVRVDDTLYLSGQVARSPGVLELVPGRYRGREHGRSLGNIRTVLKANGLGHRGRGQVHRNARRYRRVGAAFNEVYAEFFSAPFPGAQRFRGSGSRPGCPGRARVHGRIPPSGLTVSPAMPQDASQRPGLSFARKSVSCALPSGPLAQLVEQLAFNQLVAGSSPARPTIFPLFLSIA
jgi:2-iminobutanoate/2-iminopropanoate deaminase